ncbi:MAG: PIN domain-containing protein [Ilumatobacteraceae bacterium]
MIIPDVNVLVRAHRRDTDGHDAVHEWLDRALGGPEEIGLVDVVLSGFVRIVTNSRIFDPPSSTSSAVGFVDALIGSPATVWVPTGEAVWRRFAQIARSDRQIRGDLVPDAYIAACALANRSVVATGDHGFARFAGLRRLDPLDGY